MNVGHVKFAIAFMLAAFLHCQCGYAEEERMVALQENEKNDVRAEQKAQVELQEKGREVSYWENGNTKEENPKFLKTGKTHLGGMKEDA